MPLCKANIREIYGVEVTFRDVTAPTILQTKPVATSEGIVPKTEAKRQLTVMLIEDCLEDRAVYRRYLQADEDCHYRFVEAESGKEALEKYQQYQPDIVLLDYLLPDMDRLEWFSLRQQQNRQNRLPVIVLTGQGDETLAVQFIKSGAADYLVKGQLTPDKLRSGSGPGPSIYAWGDEGLYSFFISESLFAPSQATRTKESS